LFTEKNIEQFRVHKMPFPATKSIIGLDPSGDDGKDSDEKTGTGKKEADAIGQVVVDKCEDGHYYVQHDGTMNGSALQWSNSVVKIYKNRELDLIVGEKNYGGDMIQGCLRAAKGGEFVRYKGITSHGSKLKRAQPVAALYEQGLVHHVGYFPELEEELTTYNGTGKSPNRFDATMMAITELSGCGKKIDKTGLSAW
ncbi:DNA-packaging protein, partial [Candidatus Pacearchaeota archaeon]|nr:DNA-packaging protein [Candidatus Pacearchaeota archaeon]